jgi:hypothetical protein
MATAKQKTGTKAKSNGKADSKSRTAAGKKTQAKGTYGVKSWDEKTWDGKDRKEQPGAKLTHAKIVHDFHGDIKGEGRVQYVMSYLDDANATFTGLLQINGQIGERSGTFVVLVNGVFENGAAKSTWTVIPGSGTGGLSGIDGKGSTTAVHGDQQPFTFSYSFKK